MERVCKDKTISCAHVVYTDKSEGVSTQAPTIPIERASKPVLYVFTPCNHVLIVNQCIYVNGVNIAFGGCNVMIVKIVKMMRVKTYK